MADALKVHLAYRRSVALADISTAVDNVFVQTPQGYLLSNNSVLVYDNVYGGLGLTEALWWSLEEYAKQLLRGADRDRSRWDRINIFPENARRLVSWLNEVNNEPDPSPDEPGPDDWWRIIRPGSQVRLYQRERDDVAEGTLSESVWKGGIRLGGHTGGQGAGHRRAAQSTGVQFRLADLATIHRPGPGTPDRLLIRRALDQSSRGRAAQNAGRTLHDLGLIDRLWPGGKRRCMTVPKGR